jgi:hypothetical protein
MDPVFTLQWPEFILVNRLQRLLPKSQGFCVLVPASRQEKGIDLAVVKKNINGRSRVVTLQIKASRTYAQAAPRRSTIERFRFHTWFNRFEVPREADFVLLFGMYAPDASRTKRIGPEWFRDCTLLFTQEEMRRFMSSCLTVGGSPDKMFGFGFSDENKVVQTRGDKNRGFKDFTGWLLDKSRSLTQESAWHLTPAPTRTRNTVARR